MLAGLIGICFGVLLAGSRVPTIRWPQLVSSWIITAVLVGVSLTELPASFPDTMAFLLCALVSASLYAGTIWRKALPGWSLSYWGWVWRDAVQPGFLRRVYRESVTGPAILTPAHEPG